MVSFARRGDFVMFSMGRIGGAAGVVLLAVGVTQAIACSEGKPDRAEPIATVQQDPVSKPGVLQTYAGTGVPGFEGDGGRALEAMLNAPSGIAVGNNGVVVIADTGNNRVRQVRDGIISTIVGTDAVEPNLLRNGSAEHPVAAPADGWLALEGSWSGIASDCATCPHPVDGRTAFAPSWTEGDRSSPASLVQTVDLTKYAAEIDSPQGLRFQFSGYLQSGSEPDGDSASLAITCLDEAGDVLGTLFESGDLRTGFKWNKLRGDASAPAGTRSMLVELIATPSPNGSSAAFDGITLSVLRSSSEPKRALDYPLQSPSAVALAADETLYVADTGNGAVLKIGSDATVA
ncbi:MAG TPA: hypothetical protein VM686_16390, partial [Polyangiaceae bacterium]|nr:hypothetical protein [Polyangiaceae bacterium]